MDERDTANQTHTARESAIPTRVTQGDDPAGRARPPEGSAEPPTRKGIRIQWPALETGERKRLRDGTQGLPEVDVARLGEALTELWGEPVRVVGGSVRAADPSSRNTKLGESQASLTEPNEWRLGRIGVVLEDRQRGGTVVVELDPSLAAHALGRILGGGVVPSTGWLTDGERGILLYLAARPLRSTGAVG
ncbi:MAG: hypothetical protein KC416_01925 [Myxococcales bacterium]|nr:hypothetical protein [Myxococcales bacterium]